MMKLPRLAIDYRLAVSLADFVLERQKYVYALITIFAQSSIFGLQTQMIAALAILILRKVSICVRILMSSVLEYGIPLHLNEDSLLDGILVGVRLKRWQYCLCLDQICLEQVQRSVVVVILAIARRGVQYFRVVMSNRQYIVG